MFANSACRGIAAVLAGFVGCWLGTGFAFAQAAGSSSNQVPAGAAAIYDRANTAFSGAHFFKPTESAADLFFSLAPLILQEGKNAGQGSSRDCRFGKLARGGGQLELDMSRPSVYAEADTILVDGRAHARIAYTWFYPSAAGTRGGLTAQGVRLTLSSTGSPVIWEVLSDTSGLRLVYVAESIERAVAHDAKPLPGRRFAVERELNEVPDALVARVIDDGPVPMGPTLYLAQRTRDVSTLICRCMPAQATNLLATTTYELVRPGSAAGASLLHEARRRAAVANGFSTQPLETLLRLPKDW